MIQILQLGAAERVAQKAAHMAEVDPNGFILTMVSVSVVFGALIILFCAYSLSGYLFTKEKKKKPKESCSEDEAAAIAVAMDMYLSGREGSSDDEAAAIAVALDRYFDQEAVHDRESGIITIKRFKFRICETTIFGGL